MPIYNRPLSNRCILCWVFHYASRICILKLWMEGSVRITELGKDFERTAMVESRYYTGTSLQRPRNTAKNLIQDSMWSVCEMSWGFSGYKDKEQWWDISVGYNIHNSAFGDSRFLSWELRDGITTNLRSNCRQEMKGSWNHQQKLLDILKGRHKNCKQIIWKCNSVQIFGDDSNKPKFDTGGN
jgi:hypothetical protein